MKRIMFVCLGNICRSPMAEFIFKDMVKKAGLENEFIISSCATSTDEIIGGIGNPVYPPARRELEKHGISCAGKRAVQLKWADYDNYDLFIGMDSSNIRNMNIMLKGDKQNKIRKLMDYTSRCGDVADPYFTDRFDIAYRDIYEGCEGLFKALTKQNRKWYNSEE